MIPPGTTTSSAATELSPNELAAWRGMLRVTHRIRDRLGHDLTERYGLSMADYDVLVVLAAQPGRAMRMAQLADSVLQPRSSLTRIIGSLEGRGLAQRAPAPGDGRGASATLTAAGARLFARAHRTHVRNVRALFLDHLDATQIDHLAGAWAAVDPAAIGSVGQPVT